MTKYITFSLVYPDLYEGYGYDEEKRKNRGAKPQKVWEKKESEKKGHSEQETPREGYAHRNVPIPYSSIYTKEYKEKHRKESFRKKLESPKGVE